LLQSRCSPEHGLATNALIFAILQQTIEQMEHLDLKWEEFERIEMRVGTILNAYDFPEARKPAYQLTVDFGNDIGIRKTSAQITKRYQKHELIGKQIIAVVNFPPKQIGKFRSECLILGSVADDNDIVLLAPDISVENGLRIG